MTINVRPAGLDETEVLRTILSDAVASKLAHDDLSWGEKPWTTDEVRNELLVNKLVYLVRDTDTPIACFALTKEDEGAWGINSEGAIYLHKFAVANRFHGKGIGKLVLDWVVAKARTENIPYVRLDCDAKNEKLCAYYEGYGFYIAREVQLGGHATPTALFELTV